MLVAASASTKGIYRDCMKIPWLIPSSRQLNAHFHATMCSWLANIWWAYQKKTYGVCIVSIPSQSPNGLYIPKHLVYLICQPQDMGMFGSFSEAPGCHSTVQVQTWCWLEKSRWLVPIEHSWPPKNHPKIKMYQSAFYYSTVFFWLSTGNSPRPTGFCWLSLLNESLIGKGWSLQKCLPKVANHKA